MRRYIAPQKLEATHETRFGGMGVPEGFMGSTPYYVFYDPRADEFFASIHKLSCEEGKRTYIVTVYPRTSMHLSRRLFEIENFYRKHWRETNQ